MSILALELSSPVGSVASREDRRDPFERQFPNDRKHSGAFFENLQLCIDRFGRADEIVVGLGPGSYAGTRIAIAAALGLQAATGAQLFGAASVCGTPTDAEEYAVVGDARRQTFFFALVRNRSCVDGPLLCTATELEQRLSSAHYPVFCTERIAAAPQARVAFPSALLLTQIDPDSLIREPLEPIYMREPHITWPNPARVPSGTTQ